MYSTIIQSGIICRLLQLEIVGIPVGLGLALANYLRTQNFYFMFLVVFKY